MVVDGEGMVGATPGESQTVLVVDNERELLRVCHDILQAMGYRILTATGGQEALNVYDDAADEIDLVLTDMVMPGMTGQQLCEELEKRDAAAKVILMTGYAIEDDMLEKMPSRVTHTLAKPFSLHTLSRVVADSIAA